MSAQRMDAEPSVPHLRPMREADLDEIMRIELRAFGCLLEELAEHCPPEPGLALARLAGRCLLSDPAARPLFAEVEEVLAGLTGQGGQATP